MALQTQNSSTQDQLLDEIRPLRKTVDDYQYTYDVIIKKVNDLMWHQMLGDIARIYVCKTLNLRHFCLSL